MKAEEIKRYFENIKKMRSEQQAYFAFKRNHSLAEAKRLERIIDKQTPRVEAAVAAMAERESRERCRQALSRIDWAERLKEDEEPL